MSPADAKKIAITGATGFIGRALVAELRGHDVLALTRDPARAPAGTTAVRADLETPGPWQDALDGVDAIVHLAGEPIADKRWDARRKQLLRDSRIETARTIVEAIARATHKPRVLVSASGVDYYAYASGMLEDDEVTERDPPGESFLARLCRDWEAEARGAEAYGVRVACMRTGIVLGPGGGALAKMRGPIARLGNGLQWMSWIALADVVRAYATALVDARYTGPFNLVTDSIRNIEFAAALGKPRWLGAPGFALRLALGELAEPLLNGRRVVPARLRELGFTWQYPKLVDALAVALS
ncbi:MAG TPA: TIGR01777 family oxidoreductase [Kofleriaceae bacterium]|nr:TIGR01777 family oxidoreductase [Kofleriaceae bacterium]